MKIQNGHYQHEFQLGPTRQQGDYISEVSEL